MVTRDIHMEGRLVQTQSPDMNVHDEQDVLFHLPVSWIDRKRVDELDEADVGRIITIELTARDYRQGGGRGPFRVHAEDARGNYVTLTYFGHYDNLEKVTGTVINWAQEQGIEWDSTPGPTGERFASRFEIYANGPMDEPDPNKWETQIWIKTKG